MRRPLAKLTVLAGWLVAALLGGVALACLARVEESSDLLVLAVGLTPLLGLATLVPLGVGLGLRRRLLAAAGAGLAVLYLAAALPGLGLPRAAPPTGAAGLRLFTANLHHQNPDTGPIAAEIAAARPDVVVLQELGPQSGAGLRRSGVLAGYPHSLERPRAGAFGMGLWSRLPLAGARAYQVDGATMLRADVLVAGRAVTVWSVHTVAPLGQAARDRWRRQLAWLDRQQGLDRPLVMAGDFNATRWHRGMARLLDGGLDDAHERRGRGFTPTWPRGQPPVPPLLRLDHVLVSPDVGVRAVREGTGAGSDHRPLVADLVVG